MKKTRLFYAKRIWWGIREAFRNPVISALYIMYIIRLIVDRSLITILILLLMLNHVYENKEDKDLKCKEQEQ